MPGEFPTFDLQTDCLPMDYDVSTKQCTKPTMQYFKENITSDATLVALRNRFQDYLIWRSEQQCQRHTAAILTAQAATNFTLGAITTGLSAFAAIVTAPASAIMAASAATTSATKSQFNEEFYHQAIAPAVVKKIISTRQDYYLWMMNRRGTPATGGAVFTFVDVSAVKTSESAAAAAAAASARKAEESAVKAAASAEAAARAASLAGNRGPGGVPLTEYSVELAIADVETYQSLCNFSRGLSALVNPTPSFSETTAGIEARLAALRAQFAANTAAIKTVGPNHQAATTLEAANSGIATQILVLQQRLLTAPATMTETKKD